TISARASDGSAAGDFSGLVSVSARAQSRNSRLVVSEIDLVHNVIELVNPDAIEIDISGWRLETFAAPRWPEPSVAYLFPARTLVPGLGVFRLVAFGNAAGAYPILYARQPFFWVVSSPSDPLGVLLRDSEGKVIDLVGIAGFDASLLSIPTSVTAWVGDPIPYDFSATRTIQRIGSADHNNRFDWTNAAP